MLQCTDQPPQLSDSLLVRLLVVVADDELSSSIEQEH